MKLNLRVPVLLTVWLGGMALVWAADREAPADASAESSDAQSSEAPSEASAPAQASPERFVPSEQVRADFDVSFPIDM